MTFHHFFRLHNVLCSNSVCLNNWKKEIKFQLKYYSSLLVRLGERHHFLKKKYYIYEVLFISVSVIMKRCYISYSIFLIFSVYTDVSKKN